MFSRLKSLAKTGFRRRSRSFGIGLTMAGALFGLVGCQAEYAGMTLPSGRYLFDDVQYFPTGSDFPWANTLAAQQRARMRQMGMDLPENAPGGGVGAVGAPTPGTPEPVQGGFRGADLNAAPLPGGGGLLQPNAAEPPGGPMPPIPGAGPR